MKPPSDDRRLSEAIPPGVSPEHHLDGSASTSAPLVQFDAFMVSCAERELVREETLDSFRQSDWRLLPRVLLDGEAAGPTWVRICRSWRKALAAAAASPSAQIVLLVEDDILVNRWLRHNLLRWRPLADMREGWFFGSLYNPHVARILDEPKSSYFWAHPHFVWGSQALLISPKTAAFILARWQNDTSHPDRMMPLIASEMSPIVYHAPSLVDHRDVPSTWGGNRHVARDFDSAWKAP